MTKNVHMCYIGVTDRQIEKEAKMSFSNFIFIYTIRLAYGRCTLNLKTLAPIGAERSVTEIFIGEKEK